MPEKKKKTLKMKHLSPDVKEAGDTTLAKFRKDSAKHHSQFGGFGPEYLPKQIFGGFPDGSVRLKLHLENLSKHPVERYRQLVKSKKLYNKTNQQYRVKAQEEIKDPEKAAKALKQLKKHSDFINSGIDNEIEKLQKNHKEILTYYTLSDLIMKETEKDRKIRKSVRNLFKPIKEEKK